MGNCENCSGCGGCGRTLELTRAVLSLLEHLGQIPFLPVARRADDMCPVYLEQSEYTREEYSLAIQLLEKKGLVALSYDAPLAGADMTAYSAYPVQGSMALTQRGQLVLDLIEKQGLQ